MATHSETPQGWASDRNGDVLLELSNVSKTFRKHQTEIRAVDGVSLTLNKGESLGIVGESGSGKTTLARCIMALTKPTGGSILFDGLALNQLSGRSLRSIRPRMQMVFQDPYDSLNPRWKAGHIIEEPLILKGESRSDRRARVVELLSLVRLGEGLIDRYPHQLSGGQRQRVGIARAVATSPELVVLDEPTTALDWITRVDILTLLNDLRSTLGLTYVYISHDISAVGQVSDRIAVMHLGQIVELAPTQRVLSDPQHAYTRALLSAVLRPGLPDRESTMRVDPKGSARMSPIAQDGEAKRSP